MSLYEIILTVVTIILGFLSMYFKTKTQLKDNIISTIADAESAYKDVFKSGGAKFEMVVNLIYSNIPTVIKPIFNKEMVTGIVQKTFNEIERYAKQGMDNFLN